MNELAKGAVLGSLFSWRLLQIPERDNHYEVNQCKRGERVAEWTVHNVPEMKELLGFCEERDAFGEGRALPRTSYGNFQVTVVGRYKAQQSSDDARSPRRPGTQPSDGKWQ